MNHAQLEKICLALPGTKTDVKWGNNLCYTVGEKMYCVTGLEPPLKVSIKVTPEEFGELTERPGIIPAPYMARNYWIYVERSSALTPDEWRRLVLQSYDLVKAKFPKKIKDRLA
jgi:predicted DNA-binding protein (MmcQ/YjbR family)